MLETNVLGGRKARHFSSDEEKSGQIQPNRHSSPIQGNPLSGMSSATHHSSSKTINNSIYKPIPALPGMKFNNFSFSGATTHNIKFGSLVPRDTVQTQKSTPSNIHSHSRTQFTGDMHQVSSEANIVENSLGKEFPDYAPFVKGIFI